MPFVFNGLSEPLPPHAVASEHFGQDEHGPVHPSADEVREITVNHADILIDLLAEQREFQKYAEDFGEPAAEQLLAYARKEAGLDPQQRRGR